MALEVVFRLNGTDINAPINYQQLELELNFDKDNPSFRQLVSTNEWEIGIGDINDSADGANIIKDYVTNGYGVLNGIPFNIRLDLEQDGNFRDIFRGYLDLSQAQFLCDKIVAEATESNGIDFLNGVADTFTFEEMYKKGKITDKDFVSVPYTVYNPTTTAQTATTFLTIFTICITIYNLVKYIIALISALRGNPVQYGLVFTIIDLVATLLQLFILINNFNKQVFGYLFNLNKYRRGMYLIDLLRKGAEYANFTFESSIFDTQTYSLGAGPNKLSWDKVAVLPNNFSQYENEVGGKIGIENPLSYSNEKGFYRGTYGDLLRECKKMFNAKIVVNENQKIIYLERWDKVIGFGDTYQIPPVDRTEVPFKYNGNDFWRLYRLDYVPDYKDNVGLQEYEGNAVELTQIITSGNGNEIAGIQKEIQIGFSLPSYKIGLTKSELFIKRSIPFYKTFLGIALLVIVPIAISINTIITVINGIIKALELLGIIDSAPRMPRISIRQLVNPLQSYSDHYNNIRTGVLQLGDHYLEHPKLTVLKTSYDLFIQEGGKKNNTVGYRPHSDQRDLLSTSYLWDKFHYINAFVGNENNQRKIYTVDNIPFCLEEYNLVKTNNIIKDYDGKEGEIISLKWNPYKQTASITFKVKEKYANNLQLFKRINDGK